MLRRHRLRGSQCLCSSPGRTISLHVSTPTTWCAEHQLVVSSSTPKTVRNDHGLNQHYQQPRKPQNVHEQIEMPGNGTTTVVLETHHPQTHKTRQKQAISEKTPSYDSNSTILCEFPVRRWFKLIKVPAWASMITALATNANTTTTLRGWQE